MPSSRFYPTHACRITLAASRLPHHACRITPAVNRIVKGGLNWHLSRWVHTVCDRFQAGRLAACRRLLFSQLVYLTATLYHRTSAHLRILPSVQIYQTLQNIKGISRTSSLTVPHIKVPYLFQFLDPVRYGTIDKIISNARLATWSDALTLYLSTAYNYRNRPRCVTSIDGKLFVINSTVVVL
ncbi:hypothetical protein CROQUDRAFT_94236 [Cronartium quercuum f. sp. fusiforme G11]|uniref:Uncharacterized protein n=1 Tax=Cronartium quercuum f. sp. fusiforme G11 TaxID=708437 RepID=A0A9P6TAZ8_9BASI|nr:hypothetical protein CROQUDRAFT_94236 [Cronartium quercuum f. sp. fusiforme G11]